MHPRLVCAVSIAIIALSVGPSFSQELESHTALGDFSARPVELVSKGAGLVGKSPVIVFESGLQELAFTGAIVRIAVGEAAAEGWFRFRSGSDESTWHKAVSLGSGGESVRLFAARSTEVHLGARVEFAISDPSAELIEAGIFDNRLDDDATATDWDIALTTSGQTTGTIVAPFLIKRSEWGASPFRGDPVPLARPTYDYITFHHAACCAAVTYEEGLTQVKAIQEFHQDGRGWSDIGYHFLLDQSGRLYQGRPFMNEGAELDETPILAQGAHVGGANTGNIGVSALGCYHPPEGNRCTDVLSPAAYDSLITIFAFLSERYGVQPDRIMGHRDFSSTACPGDNNYRLLTSIREDVATLLETGNTPVGAANMDAVADEDGVVRLGWQFTRDDGIVNYRIEREDRTGVTVIYRSPTVENTSLTDREVTSAGSVTYRLMAQNSDGRWAPLAFSVVDVLAPTGSRLSQSFPNPAEGRSTIRYYLDQEGFVSLELFDSAGRRVSVLVNAYQEAGQWTAVDVPLSNLGPGVYYYRLQVEGFAGVTLDETRALTVAR
jgi:hypothetical protein